MRVTSYTAGLWLLAAIASARVVPDSHVLHEERDEALGSRLVKRERFPQAQRLPMRVGLKQNNLDHAEQYLMEVSHPLSEKYGQHWTQEEIVEAFRPLQESVDLVASWLEESGIGKHRISHSDNKLWLAFDATTEEAENLLYAEFHQYENTKGHMMVGTDKYYIPEYLRNHIDYVTPGVKRTTIGRTRNAKRATGREGPRRHPAPYMPKNNTDLATCDRAITPACIRALYHFDTLNPHASVSPKNSMGIYESGDFYAQEDLNSFFINFTSYIKNGTHPILNSVDGGVAPAPLEDAGGESNLDFMLAYPIIYPQTATLFQVDDAYYSSGEDEDAIGGFNTFFDAIDGSYCTYSAYGEKGDDPTYDPTYPDPNPGGYTGPLQCGVYKPTNVISISYGVQEQDLPAYYQKRQCNEFLKLGLQGVSIFVASGDSGVAGIPGDGSDNGCLKNGTVFSPTQPNSCPWLTNVGATKVLPGKTVFEPESAPDDPAGHPYRSAYYSSGGFSNIFPIPGYQSDAVASFFKNHNPPYPYYYNGNYQNSTGLYNRGGRGIPDVAANGDNIATYVSGEFSLSGGTSASAPIFASLVNRVVEERLRLGKGPGMFLAGNAISALQTADRRNLVGFVNPVLYSHPYVLNDIVNGSNPGCGTQGFSCAPGWDPVTGLGTPNYPRMLQLFLSLP